MGVVISSMSDKPLPPSLFSLYVAATTIHKRLAYLAALASSSFVTTLSRLDTPTFLSRLDTPTSTATTTESYFIYFVDLFEIILRYLTLLSVMARSSYYYYFLEFLIFIKRLLAY